MTTTAQTTNSLTTAPMRTWRSGPWLVCLMWLAAACGTPAATDTSEDTFVFVVPDAATDAGKKPDVAQPDVPDVQVPDVPVVDVQVPDVPADVDDVQPDVASDVPAPDTGAPDTGLPACVTDTDCDDGDWCTVDLCVNENCKHTAQPGCCKSASDCAAPGTCKVATCVNNICGAEVVENCCASGPCCDTSTQQPKAAAEICADPVISVEFGCAGSDIYGRRAKLGCDGVSTAACSGADTDLNWTDWGPVASCANGGLCQKNADKHVFPTCSGGDPITCVNDIGCSDGDPCTIDTCTAGVCSHPLAPSTTLCGVPALFTEYACLTNAGLAENVGGAVVTRSQHASCGGLGQCDGKAVWTPWTVIENCTSAQKCDVPISTEPGTCVALPVCKPGQPCCDADGQWQPAGTACGTSTVASEYKCESTTTKGAKYQVRQGVAGCAGTSGQCGAGNPAWGNWKPAGQCADNELCAIPSSGGAPVCTPVCDAGTTCCTASADWADQGTQCADVLQKSIFSCTFSAGSPAVVQNDLFPGCTGTDTTCSTDPVNLSKSAATIVKVCQSYEKCQATGDNAACVLNAPCQPGSQCCTANGQWAPTGTPCLPTGTTQFDCSNNLPGGSVITRDVFYGCSGVSKECSYGVADYYYSPWTTSSECLASEVCTADPDQSAASCNSIYKCTPGSVCCTLSGDYAAQGTPCGKLVAKTEYMCSGPDLGASILKKEYIAGCVGTSNTCSSADADLVNYPPGWFSKAVCSSGTYCHVQSLSDSGVCNSTPP